MWKNYQVVFEEPGYPRMYAKKTCRHCHGTGRLGQSLSGTEKQVTQKMPLCRCLLKGDLVVPPEKPVDIVIVPA